MGDFENNHTKNNITETTTTTTTIKTEKPETIMQIPIQQAPPTMNSHIGTPVVEQATANIASVNAGSPPMQNHTAAISPSLANATVRQTSPQFTMQPPSQQQQQQQPFAFAQPQRYPGVAYQTPFLQQQQPQPYVNSPTDISSNAATKSTCPASNSTFATTTIITTTATSISSTTTFQWRAII